MKDKNLYRYRVQPFYQALLLVGPVSTLISFLFEGDLYLGLLVIPLLFMLLHLSFNNIIVLPGGVKIFRIFFKSWNDFKYIKKINKKLYIARVEGFPFFVKIKDCLDFDELIGVLKGNVNFHMAQSAKCDDEGKDYFDSNSEGRK